MNFLEIDHIKGVTIPNCGTAACIAGWALCLSQKINPIALRFKGGNQRIILGLEDNEIVRLQWFSEWPSKFQKHTKEGTPAFARQAVARIEHFIKTKGAE